MSNVNHTKVVNIPYPGRDVAILSLFFIPFLPLIGLVLARHSIAETKKRGYSEIGIQEAAYMLNALMVLFQVLVIFGILASYRGWISFEWVNNLAELIQKR